MKSCSDWWKLSNSLKIQKVLERGNLYSDHFILHFSNLFKINIDNLDTSWCMPYVVDPILDSPIKYWELVSVVRKLNDKKPPGKDGVCYEFYKNAPNCFFKKI